MKRRIILILFVLLVLAPLGAWSLLIEPNRLVTNETSIQLADWPAELDGVRITALSDIHAGSPFIDEAKLRHIVERTNQTRPDLIVLLGDYMVRDTWHSKSVAPEVMVAALKHLRAPLGVYAVLGNHDWWYDGNKVRAAFENGGIRVLDNELSTITFKNRQFCLVGLADAWTGRDAIDATTKQIPAGLPAIAITHNPDILPRLPPVLQLTLAGHTHGGQVLLPLLGRRVVPSEYGQKYAAGLVQEGGKQLFVTTGIGTSVFPIRFRVPPEIAVLTLRSR
jgi:uncharacterized protein